MNSEVSGREAHWDRVYSTKQSTEVSWYQPIPDRSLRMIADTGVERQDALIDIGGGASTLTDRLLASGYGDLTVLDVSASAFRHCRTRLGESAGRVEWIVTDVTRFEPRRHYRLWHDRAVLHFLVDESERQRYRAALCAALPAGGHLIIATFGPGGPQRCSGLEVRRYDAEGLQSLLGSEFALRDRELEDHVTPSGATQQFLYTRWQRTQT